MTAVITRAHFGRRLDNPNSTFDNIPVTATIETTNSAMLEISRVNNGLCQIDSSGWSWDIKALREMAVVFLDLADAMEESVA